MSRFTGYSKLSAVMRAFCLVCISSTIFFFSSAHSVHAANELPFEDVTPKDDFYDDLLSLYKRGIISLSSDNKFYPKSEMRRDDFVSIVVGVSCKSCLAPSFEDILKYNKNPFVDFDKKNENFYCVSYAKEVGIVRGYSVDASGKSRCFNGTEYSDMPFCEANSITRIEAAAVLLRQGGLWSETKNSSDFKREIQFSDVSEDWYGYAQKSVQTGLLSIDSSGRLYPDKPITRAEFVKMAAKIFRTNICSVRSNGFVVPSNSSSTGTGTSSTSNPSLDQSQQLGTSGYMLSSQLSVLSKTDQCNAATQNSPIQLTDTKRTLCAKSEGGTNPVYYDWELIRQSDGKKLTATGSTLQAFDFGGPGTWLARVMVRDNNGKTSTSVGTVYITDGNVSAGISLQIRANPLSPDLLSNVVFTSVLQGGKGPFAYRWDFGDGVFSSEQSPTHAYQIPGVKTVILTVRDSEGTVAISQLVVSVEGDNDLDNDGVKNDIDACPLVFGGELGIAGCPKVVQYNPSKLDINGSGSTDQTFVRAFDTPGFYGTIDLSMNGTNGMCRFLRARDSGGVFGRRACSACPCTIELDYVSSLRACDIVFPAILSPSKNDTYARGKVFEFR